MTAKWTMILDVLWGVAKASWARVELAINADMSKSMAVEASFIEARVIWG